jgi:4-alpha-glucanotransferase
MIHTTRRAGVSVPLFSLRSSQSWGIGEIADLPLFAEWLRAARQSVLQILPLNALAPGESSPYSALSAMAIDPQFISVRMLPRPPAIDDRWNEDLERVRRSPTVDYGGVRRLKTRALRAAFREFLAADWAMSTSHAEALRAYAAAQSWWLDEYSLFRALKTNFGERSWLQWPAEFRDRQPASIADARRELASEVLYHQWLQWIAESQWQDVRRATRDIEVLGDFPFMVTVDSADVWSRRDDFMLDASVGTPPDAFSETGQEWGLPPYNWEAARTNGLEWLRMRARRQAELYDGFRVDHLVGFYRTYVRPYDGPPPYFMPGDVPQQTVLGETVMRIMIETGADVSVEDLGTVPDFVRESIARLGLPGYKVLRWEPGPPASYPAFSVAMTGTHDTETLAVWWESIRVEEQQRLGVHTPSFDASVRDALLELMYNAGSNLVLLPIQDIFGWRDRINHPATISDRNWTYVLPWPVDSMGRTPEAIERAARLAESLSRAGR